MKSAEMAMPAPREIAKVLTGETLARTVPLRQRLKDLSERFFDWYDQATPEEIDRDRRLQEFLSRNSKVK